MMDDDHQLHTMMMELDDDIDQESEVNYLQLLQWAGSACDGEDDLSSQAGPVQEEVLSLQTM